MLKPRTKLISLRMTEDEYEAVRHASVEGAARCVSDFVRNALLESARPALAVPTAQGLTGCALLTDFDRRLTRVESGLAKLSEELQRQAPDCAKESD